MTANAPGDAVERRLDTDGEPATAVVEAVAELRGVDPTELDSIYGCIDHVLDHIFSNPPVPDAAVSVTFSYEGFRITVDQDGTARFVDVEE